MSQVPAVLVVDDERGFCATLCKEFVRKGYPVRAAHDRAGALVELAAERADVALIDLSLGKDDGVELLREVRREYPTVQVIMLTGNATVETAIEAMKLGAYDYLTKPCHPEELLLLIGRAFEAARMRRENEVLKSELTRQGGGSELIGKSSRMEELRGLVRKIAPAESPILISGETGVGKELVARMFHAESRRRDGPFIALNCSAFQETLLESELFGYERGAFTGAVGRKPGLIELADGGTLFLDEIGTMSPGVQMKLLRFLDSGEYRRLGGTQSLRSKARVLSATNQDLGAAIQDGRFREDLFYRINVVRVEVPALRERKEDIQVLAEHFLAEFRARGGRGPVRLSRAARDVLAAYDWPGNVRELKNAVERAYLFGEGKEVQPDDFRLLPRPAQPSQAPQLSPDSSLAAVEKEHILRVLNQAQGSRTRAAAILGIDAKTLYNKLKSY
ncbi:MAG: hypothetical protein A2X36_16005 [Elusimicrobia bacterium GWA2_69_24]|nr:MAG: hypothetical protein A2X36_16005 [Elusimicrobia bacterium GWA2_69_24]HBL16608.1 hypothetical protein [Elusimicrobiota bacterium]